MEVDITETSPNPSSAAVEAKEKEGRFLLGSPTFIDLGNGRLRCEETGHELPAKDKDSYSRTKACRLALIDAAVSKKKPPLNTFLPHPISRSNLVCSLTGNTINKSEEHIWKHINGRRFLKKLGCLEGRNHGQIPGDSEGKSVLPLGACEERARSSLESVGVQPMLIDDV